MNKAEAIQLLEEAKSIRREIEDQTSVMEDAISEANKAHKALTAKLNNAIKPLKERYDDIRGSLSEYAATNEDYALPGVAWVPTYAIQITDEGAVPDKFWVVDHKKLQSFVDKLGLDHGIMGISATKSMFPRISAKE